MIWREQVIDTLKQLLGVNRMIWLWPTNTDRENQGQANSLSISTFSIVAGLPAFRMKRQGVYRAVKLDVAQD